MSDIQIEVSEIGLVHWEIIGPLKKEKEFDYEVDLNTSFQGMPDESTVIVVISASFKYQDPPNRPILEAKVNTSFKIHASNEKDLATLDIPKQGIITMLSLSISHARALITTHARGLGFIVPIVNPSEMYSRMEKQSEKSYMDKKVTTE